MNRIAVVSLLALTPALVQADSVFLKGGGEIKGEIVERSADAVVLEVGPGRVSVAMRNVARIVSSTSDVGLYNARAAALAPRDLHGWLDLAAWAQASDLATQAREAYRRVLAVDPRNAAAHIGLGDVQVGDRWMSLAAANRARGLVELEGVWMTPEEQEARFAERAAAAQERQALREADARVREADARAREAEARASAAEADARQPSDGGIPYPGIYGPSYGPVYGPYGSGRHYRNRYPHQSVPPTRPIVVEPVPVHREPPPSTSSRRPPAAPLPAEKN